MKLYRPLVNIFWRTTFLAALLLVVGASADCGRNVADIVPEWNTAPANVPSDGGVDGPLLGNGGLGVVVGGPSGAGPSAPGGLLTLYAGLTSFWASEIDGFSHCGYGDGGLKQPGGMTLSFSNDTDVTFHARQWISEGRVEAAVSDGKRTVSINMFVSAQHDIALLTAAAEGPGPIPVTVTLWTVDGCGLPYEANEFQSGGLHVRRVSARPYQAARKGVTVTTADLVAQPINSRFDSVATDGARVSGSITITPGAPATIAFAATDGGRDHAANLVEMAMEDGAPARIKDEHKTWWRNFWSQSCVAFPSQPTLERYWYGSQYVLALSAREGRTPPGLWGSFITSDSPGWQGDYTLNYNAQSPYFGALSSNHPEMSAAQFQPYLDFISNGRDMARKYYDCDGVVFPGHIGPHGMVSTDVQTMGQLSNAAFAAVNFVWHYEFTRDKGFLEEKAYPFVKEVALFWRCWLERNDTRPGEPYRYVDRNDCVNELCDASDGRVTHNPVISLSFIRFVVGAAARWSRALGIDGDLRVDWVDIVEHLSDYPTANVTMSEEGGEDEMLTVFAPSEGEEPQPPGSNPFEAYPMHPVSDVNLSSDRRLIEIGRNTLRRLQSWGSGNAFPLIFASAVRINYNSTEVLANLLANIRANMGTNLYYLEGGGGIEGAGGTLALNEMMLQSAEGFVRFFPALDPAAMPASFQTLRTKGGFLVSASITKDGTVQDVVVERPGPSDCHAFEFLSPWPEHVHPVVTLESGSKQVDVKNLGGSKYLIELNDGDRARIAPVMTEGALRGIMKAVGRADSDGESAARHGAVWI